MGQYRIEITAVGGHGCQREIKDSDSKFFGCGAMDCPDCMTAKFVADLKRANNHVESATLVHWPETATQVTDTFEVEATESYTRRAPRTRKGSF